MKAYSLDLRERIVVAAHAGTPLVEVARVFGVGYSTLHRYLRQYRQTGELSLRPIPGRPRRIASDDLPALLAQLEASPDATIAEHCVTWNRDHRSGVSASTMHRTIVRLGFTRKKRPSSPASRTP